MNNKGITLIEIIISIVLISIVLIFLFSLLVTVKDINFKSEVNSTYLINKSLILKNIEEDFSKAKEIKVYDCDNIQDLYSKFPTDPNDTTYFQKDGVDSTKLKSNKCLKFEFTWDDDVTLSDNEPIAHFGIYYYKNKNNYVISYIRGNNRVTRELPEFEKYNIVGNTFNSWTYSTGAMETGFHNIYIPIIGSDGKDYSLNISYYKP